MKHFMKQLTCFLLAFLFAAGTASLNPVCVNAKLTNIVKPETWEVASGNVPVVKDFTLPPASTEVGLYVGTNAPCSFNMMIFNSEDMEVDSIRITESDSSWATDSNGIYANGYQGSFPAGDYHVSITFDVATAFQFAVIANVQEAVISNTVLTITEGFTKNLSVKDNTGTVKWKSGKPAIASVDKNGKVTAKKPGKCTITATVDGKTLKCTVTVKSNKFVSAKLTNSEIPYGKASWEAYGASYDEKGNLTIKFRMINNCGHYSEYLKNLSVKVKTAKGSTVASYKEAKKMLYVADQSYKDFSITIPKADLKVKKTVDLRNAKILTDGSFGYTYYTY